MRILHLMGWYLNDISDEVLDEVSHQGFDAIQISPLQPTKDDSSLEWWMDYQPIAFRIGNRHGSKEDLKNLCERSHYHGISVYGDLVCNHTANAIDEGMNLSPSESRRLSMLPSDKVDIILRENPYFWKERIPIDWDHENRYATTHYCMGLPGLNLANYDLQEIVFNLIDEYRECGLDGLRFDAAKSIALPGEANYYGWRDKNGNLEDDCKFWSNLAERYGNTDFVMYGEILFPKTDYLFPEYQKYIYTLSDTPSGDLDKCIIFAESHDSWLGMGYTKWQDRQRIMEEYERRAHIYKNTLFYPRIYPGKWETDDMWKSDEVRRANGKKVKTYSIHY